MRAKTGVEDGVVFQNYDGGFDGVEGGAAAVENGPACGESTLAAGFARVNGFIRNIPGAAVNDERRCHSSREWQSEMAVVHRTRAAIAVT